MCGAVAAAASRCRAGLLRATVASLVVVSGPAAAQPVDEATEAPMYAAPTRLDRIGRVVAAVKLNGAGPFRFVLDTGSNRSAISPKLAATLGLTPDPGTPVEVHGVTGSAVVPGATVAELQIGDITLRDQRLPVLPDPVFSDADGILGVAGLEQARIEVDFAGDRVSIRRSSGRRATGEYLVVRARPGVGGLLLVSGRVGAVPAKVILDTGAERTIGNRALQDALQKRARRDAGRPATIIGATPGAVEAVAFESPTIAIGEARLNDVAVTFGDLHVFQLWGLLDEPALVVGMDVLGTVERLVFDYRRHEFQVKPRDIHGVEARSCHQGACGTRLPDYR